MVSWMLIAMHLEGKAWNNGACPQCGCAWQQFDTDSQGGNGYKCSNGCNETIWITFNFGR